jgi:hypothetical protein
VVTDADRAWWAFQPLTRVEPPAPGHPIDAFLNAKLSAKGIAMNPPAEPRALIRRLHFDLTGLPPTSEEVEAFVRESHSSHQSHQSHGTDGRNETHEQVVNRLLASPHYGERWGRHWLDLARYGESHGYEQDYDRPNAWHYRDFVIRALNADMPFDQFVRWQIAGDELAPDDPEAWKATGFLAAGTHATQITANQAEKERYDELDDKIGTIGTAMLGLTIGCARCHDHKFDPIPTNDYYRLLSTFTTTVRSDYDLVVDPKKYAAAKAQWDAEHAQLTAARDRFENEQLPARLAAWEKTGARPQMPKWLVLDSAGAKSAGGATFAKQADGSFLASGANVDNDTYTFAAPAPEGGITAVKIEALADKSLAKSGPGRAGNGNFALSMLELSAAGQPVKFARALATFEQSGLPVAAAIDTDKTSSWAVDPQFGKDHAAVFVLEAPLAAPAGSPLTFTLKFSNNKQHSIGRPRLSVTTDAAPTLDGSAGSSSIADAVRVLEKPAAQRSADDAKKLLAWFRAQDDEWRKLDDAVAEHARKEPQPEKVKALICSEGVPPLRLNTQGPDFYEKTFLLKRGDLNQKLDEAAAGFSHGAFSRARAALAHRAARRFAHAVAPDRAREVAYRHGRGRGEPARARDREPALAAPFWARARGDAERFRGAGRKAIAPRAARLARVGADSRRLAAEADPPADHDERRLRAEHRVGCAARGDRSRQHARLAPRKQRLEGETIRDAILAVTGALDAKMFGPGTLDPTMKRRSIYFQIKRSQLRR